MTLPVLRDGLDEVAVIDPSTGELAPLRDATDRALVNAARLLAEHDRDVLDFKRALARELRVRHGVGKAEAGGYGFTVTESSSWPLGAVTTALERLVAAGAIGDGDARRCVPQKPKPDAVQLRSLLGRLMVSDPDAARLLAAACTTSPPSVREVREVAVDVEA